MRRIQVDYVVDDTVARQVIEADGHTNCKVHADGRGYVKVAGRTVLYRRVERIEITDVQTGGTP